MLNEVLKKAYKKSQPINQNYLKNGNSGTEKYLNSRMEMTEKSVNLK